MGERDKPHSYRHERSSPMRDYSLFIMVMRRLMERLMMITPEGGGGVDPFGGGSRQRFPPPIFSGGSLLPLCFWFCVSPPPPSGKHRGTIFIVAKVQVAEWFLSTCFLTMCFFHMQRDIISTKQSGI